jgi:hypothetical protein
LTTTVKTIRYNNSKRKGGNMPSTQHDVKGIIHWAKVFESNRDRAHFHSSTDGAYKVTVVTDEATMKSLKKEGCTKQFKKTDDGFEVTFDRPHKGDYDWQGGAPIVADVTGKAWDLDEKGLIGNGSTGIVKIALYRGKDMDNAGSRLLGLQVLDHVVYESEGGSSQSRSMFADHSKSSGGKSSSQKEPQDSVPF